MDKSGTKALGFVIMIVGLVLGLVGSAHAVDGVIEINQARVTAGGVTPGDTPGFPVTLSEPGSYRLTGNLVMPDTNTTGIEITASHITIDLNGFGILGPVICSGRPINCSATGSGRGISSSSGTSNIEVINGIVRGMGGHGIDLITSNNAHVERVRITSNGSGGILAGDGSTVTGNTANFNRGNGIFTLSSTVTGNTASFNGLTGILISRNSILTGNTASFNGFDGIFVGDGNTVVGNTASFNNNRGIFAGAGNTVTGNTASSNGNMGIFADAGSSVTGNTASLNGGSGLNLGNNTGYTNNVITGNSGGTVIGGIQMGTNLCNTSTTCP
jgi:parallel beta-helix repeat protein